MNETDFIRQQLATERDHLRDILHSVRIGTVPCANAGPVMRYVDWAGQRLLQRIEAHRQALDAASGVGPDTRALLARVTAAAATAATAATAAEAATQRPPHRQAEQLLALLEAWNESLETAAGKSLRIAHWRAAGHLSADSILEERQLYAAARTAAGVT